MWIFTEWLVLESFVKDQAQELWDRARQTKSEEDFRQLHDFLWEVSLRFVKNTNEEIKKEIIQEAIMKVWQSLHGQRAGYDSEQSFLPWFSQILMNTWRDHMRKIQSHERRIQAVTPISDVRRGRIGTPEPTQLSFDPEIEEDDPDAIRVRQVISQLSPGLRSVIELLLKGRKYGEIADDLGIPLGTVKSRLDTAKRIIKSRVAR